MTTPAEAAQMLKDAIENVEHPISKRVHLDPGANVLNALPACIIGPPDLEWVGYGKPPAEATFEVFVIVQADANALAVLWELVPMVALAIDEHSGNGTVKRAVPGTWQDSLPAYIISVDFGL